MTKSDILTVAADRLIAAVEEHGPGSPQALAIAGELASAGIVSDDSAGLDPAVYATDRTVAARYILGQLLALIDYCRAERGEELRMFVAAGYVSAARRFRQELLGPVAEVRTGR